MTSVMLACYPEVFAGGAIIAGLPYGAASECAAGIRKHVSMSRRAPPARGAIWCGRASAHGGPWPLVSVWHGGADATVIPSNADEILKQWTNVHDLPMTPSIQTIVDGYPRQVWINHAGDELIKFYTIPHMAHGTPLATGDADDECGAAGPFLLEVGISSSYHIAKFFELTSGDARKAGDARTVVPASKDIKAMVPSHLCASRHEPLHTQPEALEGEVLHPELHASPNPTRFPRPAPIDIGAVITNALRAAGLMKDQ